MKKYCYVFMLGVFWIESQALPVVLKKSKDIGVNAAGKDNPELIGGFFEGDMDIKSTYNGVIDAAKRWPKGVVWYKIGLMYDRNQFLYILRAMKNIESHSCIRFRPARDTTSAFILITDDSRGCHATVGYSGSKQIVGLQPNTLGSGCFKIGSIMHELLHALGFYHQHSSPDRDNYVKIITENIKEDKLHSFRKTDVGIATNFGMAYDYESVMHYSATTYSKNGKETIIPLQHINVTMGQRLYLSEGDIKKLNLLYSC